MIPLRIHCWGGIGSQLLAVALLVDLESRFPSRNFILVLHQGGVTLRESEIDDLFIGITTKHVLDFGSDVGGSSSGIIDRQKAPFKNLIKLLFQRLSLILPLSGDEDFQKIHRFTLSIRGHYSYRHISPNTVQGLIDKLRSSARDDFELGLTVQDEIGVHYRLGDLLILGTKQPLGEERIATVIEDVATKLASVKITVFSDSPKVAVSRIQNQITRFNVDGPDATTWVAICHLSKTKYFVGTFSKVSLWVVIFRYYSKVPLVSYMPIESKENIENLLGANLIANKIIFY